MELRRITAYDVGHNFDQTSEWLNRLNEKIENLERRVRSLEG